MGRIASVRKIAQVTLLISVPKSPAIRLSTNTTRKKSNASSIQPKKLAVTTFRCVGPQVSVADIGSPRLSCSRYWFNRIIALQPLQCARGRPWPRKFGASLLLRLDKVSLSYGSRPLLDQVSLQLDEGERVALIGRNGEGKSSLLRVLLHQTEPDAGAIWVRPGARVAHLAQDLDATLGENVAQVITEGLPQQGRALAEYQ